MEKNIYELNLSESTVLVSKANAYTSYTLTATRVPGGWIYRTFSTTQSNVTDSTVFVPYSDEFNSKPKAKKGSPKVTPV